MLQSFMKKSILFILILVFSLYAKVYPSLYAQLGTPLFKSVKDFKYLSTLDSFAVHKDLIQKLDSLCKEAIKKGFELDKNPDKEEIKAYLKALRQLQTLHDKIEKSYKQQLYKSIYSNDKESFFILLKRPLSLVRADARLKQKVVEFYKTTGQTESSYLKALYEDYNLDERSYAHMNKMFKLYEEKKDVISRKSLDIFSPDYKAKKIEVLSVKVKDGFDIYLENHTFSVVSVKLHLKQMHNLSSDVSAPYINSYPSRSRSKMMHLSIIEKSKKSDFSISYGTMLGSLVTSYNKKYVYALPYKRGKTYLLTQGFNGKATHNGNSAYALDFSMAVGSHVHAMREGIVTGIESKNNEHGFSIKFASKANYIIIQHEDGTMAMYGHLKQNGVKVKLGERVYKHQLIGYSGNTGYSSGPHLHVHISAITNFDKGSKSVPFIFLSKGIKVNKPIEKRYYRAN